MRFAALKEKDDKKFGENGASQHPCANHESEAVLLLILRQLIERKPVEFPRFGGHLLTEFVSVGEDVCYAEDAAVFVGVPS